MRGLNLEHLRIFLDVIELGSFSAAADKHGLTQPAVSLQVRQLERRYGLRLVERVGRRATPTAAGKDLMTYIRTIVATCEEAERNMQVHSQRVVGRVRLGTGATACTYLLPQVLADLRARFPSLEIVVSTGNTVDILRGIETNTIDIGLVTLPVRGQIFQVTPVLDDEFVAISPRNGRCPTKLTPREMVGLFIIKGGRSAFIKLVVAKNLFNGVNTDVPTRFYPRD